MSDLDYTVCHERSVFTSLYWRRDVFALLNVNDLHVCKFIHLADHKYKKQSLFHLLFSTRQFLNKGVNTL